MIFEIYVASLVVGGGLLAFSTIFGGDHDSDHDLDGHIDCDTHLDFEAHVDVDFDADMDADVDADIDADVDGDGAQLPAVLEHAGEIAESGLPWLPFLTLRFWTFGVTFFGLFGTLATLLGLGSPSLILGMAMGAGGLSGGVAATVIQYLKTNQVNSAVQADEWIGASARVILPITAERAGKVRVTIRGGRTLDRKAVSKNQTLSPGDKVLVVEDRGGHVVVEGLA